MSYCSGFQRISCPDNGQVPVDTDNSDKEHAPKETDVVQRGNSFTCNSPKGPSTDRVGCPEWEGDHKEKVRDSQVQEIDVSDTFFIVTFIFPLHWNASS